MLKKLLVVGVILATSANAFAGVSTGSAFVYDASGNPIASTASALNVNVQNATLAVTQSTSPWVVKDQADGPVAPGTVASFSLLTGLQYNSTPPTLTNTQQAAMQGDSSGNLKVNLATALPTGSNVIGAVTQSAGPWTVNQTQVGGSAITLGQKTMANSYPVVIASDQTSIPVTFTAATLATYAAVVTGLVPAASATDILTIIGSASKTIKVFEVRLMGSAGSAGSQEFDLIKRSTLDTGGTSTTATNVSFDSTNAAPTVVIKAYTANPSALGTSLGLVDAQLLFIPKVAGQLFDIKYGEPDQEQGITLNSATENLAVNLAGGSVSSGNLSFMIRWTEQ